MIKEPEKIQKVKQYLTFFSLDRSKRLTVTYPEFFWADQNIHQIHEGTTMVGIEWVHFQNWASKCSNNALSGPVS